jgi:hypothetical protein
VNCERYFIGTHTDYLVQIEKNECLRSLYLKIKREKMYALDTVPDSVL